MHVICVEIVLQKNFSNKSYFKKKIGKPMAYVFRFENNRIEMLRFKLFQCLGLKTNTDCMSYTDFGPIR